jgi:hypothetical protein
MFIISPVSDSTTALSTEICGRTDLTKNLAEAILPL